MAELDTILDLSMLSNSEDAELPELRAALVQILFEQTDLELDRVYSLVYNDGRKILWN